MEDPSPAVPVHQKRPREEDAEPQPSTPVKAISSQASTPLSILSSVQTPSPMQTANQNATAATSSSNVTQTSTQAGPASSSTQQPVKKKQKVLTQQEKDDAAREKEAKAKAKADKLAQKEAEAKLKADKKAQKAAQKEAESKTKAEEKAKKEAEKREKDEEKAKKERSQMKLNAFFVKPKAAANSTELSVVDSNPDSTAPSTSLFPDIPGAVTNAIPPSPQKSIQKNAQSDYERCFLPFSLPSHAILAPANAFMGDTDKLNAARARLDQLKGDDHAGLQPATSHTLKISLPARARRGLRTATIVEVIKQVHGSPDRPLDLTNTSIANQQQPLEMLKDIPMKYLHFGEDVRPPYYGTYTKPYSDTVARRLARNAVSRIRQDTNYDYDSEAEWEEPEEGEDLDSEGEDDAEEEGDDDMDGFLDDEEDPQLKRRMLSGDLVPVSTGLCWEDANGVSKLNDGSDAICTEFKGFKMEFLLGPYPQSIDPFSTAYWTPPEPIATSASTASKQDTSTKGLMNPPPRVPLVQRTMNGLLNTLNTTPSLTTPAASKASTPKKMIPDDQLPAFKAEIQGKDLTKIGMIEALKKAFPKLPKAAITNTLSTVAARVGPTEKEKRWVLINP
ncbi:chromatin assembly factor-I (CAF-I) p90 subunit [Neodidymelliopsis sp. IMI 364377]|nr:chromatin assembly factor-I (CAF-I) p90 subunit [Neodidymelliopsis sp. IMI 364377]